MREVSVLSKNDVCVKLFPVPVSKLLLSCSHFATHGDSFHVRCDCFIFAFFTTFRLASFQSCFCLGLECFVWQLPPTLPLRLSAASQTPFCETLFEFSSFPWWIRSIWMCMDAKRDACFKCYRAVLIMWLILGFKITCMSIGCVGLSRSRSVRWSFQCAKLRIRGASLRCNTEKNQVLKIESKSSLDLMKSRASF